MTTTANMTARKTDCLIVGGGQAGLAMSRCLADRGIDHVVIERGRIGERWRSERWPSLRLLTPGWMTRLPGRALADAESGFLTSADLVSRLETYAETHAAPIVTGTSVLSIERIDTLFRVATSTGTWLARSVVIASGACDKPLVPGWGEELSPSLYQLTPNRYLGAEDLPEGGVLVVGASATGVQLAREIAGSGRRVILSAGRHVRSPRRYRGRDLFEWLDACGFLADRRPAGRSDRELLRQPSLQLIGSDDDAEIDLYRLAEMGIAVTGRALGGNDRTVTFARDLGVQCRSAEAHRQRMLARIDAHIEANAIEAPTDHAAWIAPHALPAAPGSLDLRAQGIATVLWATGFRRSYPWLHLPVLGRDGEIVHRGGVTRAPGVFALGLPTMRHRASAFIDGVGRDAEALAPQITTHLGAALPLAA